MLTFDRFEGEFPLSIVCFISLVLVYGMIRGYFQQQPWISFFPFSKRTKENQTQQLAKDSLPNETDKEHRKQLNTEDPQSHAIHDEIETSDGEDVSDTSDDLPLLSRSGFFDYSPDDTMEETLSEVSSEEDYCSRYSAHLTTTAEEERRRKLQQKKDILEIFNIDYISDEDEEKKKKQRKGNNDEEEEDTLSDDEHFDFQKRSLFPPGSIPTQSGKYSSRNGEDRSPLYNEDYCYEDEDDTDESESEGEVESTCTESSEASSTVFSTTRATTLHHEERDRKVQPPKNIIPSIPISDPRN